MKNPYEVLGVRQDVTAAEINQGFNQAQMKNMKSRQHTAGELMTARQQLLSPARRLAADFVYPSRPRARRPRAIVWPDTSKEISLTSFLPDAYSSL